MQVAKLLAEYVLHRVVRRHTWVALQKLRRQRDYTFLFEARDGWLTRRADYMPVATTPRLAPSMQFLADIHLVVPGGLTARNAIAGDVSGSFLNGLVGGTVAASTTRLRPVSL